MESVLLAGARLRPARIDDAVAICALMAEIDRSLGSQPWVTEQDIRDDLADPSLTLETDTWVIEEGGEMLAYGELWNSSEPAAQSFEVQLYVAPGHRGRGIGSHLVSLSERRALEAAKQLGRPPAIRNFIPAADRAAGKLLVGRGYAPVRYFFHMEIVVKELPTAADVSPGLTLRSLDPERDAEDLHSLIEHAFSDQWGWVGIPQDEFKRRYFERPDADPDLTPLIFEGGRLVGASLNGTKLDRGWIEDLAVHTDYRGRGLGELLLHESFRRFADKGWERVGLGVDVDNPTGALRLYERVGMTKQREFVAYERDVSPS